MKIDEITLFTNNISKQKQFYKETLGFQIIEDSPEQISFKAGRSTLVFQYKEDKIKPSHLAFNIPNNTINIALEYLKDRVEVLSFENKFISDFASWKAKAIYFYDADKNIMEFIARKLIDIKSDVFTTNSIVSISEMAIATDDIQSIHNQINMIKPISIFDGSFDRFCALGDDEGLFIIIDKNKKKWHPTMEEAFISDFIIKGDYNFSFINGKIKELS